MSEALFDLEPVFEVDDYMYIIIDRLSFDPITGRSTNRRIVIRDGVRRDKPFSIRHYNYFEIRQLLAAAGLEIQSVTGGWQRQPFTAESHAMAIVARKAS